MVPINHSDNDKIAVEKAIQIAHLSGEGAEVICQNIYNVPTGYHYTGKNFEEFSKVMNEHTQKKFATLIKKIDTKGVIIKPIYTIDRKEDPIEVVYQFALETKPDTIVLGAKAQSTTTAIFLISIAEKLIQVDEKFPIRIVRKKGDNAGIMEFLRKI